MDSFLKALIVQNQLIHENLKRLNSVDSKILHKGKTKIGESQIGHSKNTFRSTKDIVDNFGFHLTQIDSSAKKRKKREKTIQLCGNALALVGWFDDTLLQHG